MRDQGSTLSFVTSARHHGSVAFADLTKDAAMRMFAIPLLLTAALCSLPGSTFAQQANEDAAAVKRRQRKQVEGPHHEVDHDAGTGHFQEETLLHAAGHEQHQHHGPGDGLDEVRRRTRERESNTQRLHLVQVAYKENAALGRIRR